MVRAGMVNSDLLRFYGEDMMLSHMIKRDFYPASNPEFRPKREFAISAGRALGEIINGNSARVEANLRKVLKQGAEICPTLTDNERVQLDDVQADSILKLYDLRPLISKSLITQWQNLCH